MENVKWDNGVEKATIDAKTRLLVKLADIMKRVENVNPAVSDMRVLGTLTHAIVTAESLESSIICATILVDANMLQGKAGH